MKFLVEYQSYNGENFPNPIHFFFCRLHQKLLNNHLKKCQIFSPLENYFKEAKLTTYNTFFKSLRNILKIKMKNFDPDWYVGFLNNFKVISFKPIIEKGERPPYPIVNYNPNIEEVFNNWNKADTGILLAFSLVGFIVNFINKAFHLHTDIQNS